MGYHTMVTTTSESPPPPAPPFREPPAPVPPSNATYLRMDSRKLQVMYKKSSSTSRSRLSCSPTATNTSVVAPFDILSDDLVLKILSFLPTNVLCLCARVCRRFYFLVWEPQLWTQIKLTVNNCDQTLATLLRLLARDLTCQAVEKVCLNRSVGLTDTGLDLLARHCPNLRSFEAKNCRDLTNLGVQTLVTKCLELNHIDLSGETFLPRIHGNLTGTFNDFNKNDVIPFLMNI